MRRKPKKSSVWTAKIDTLLKEYYAIYKKPMELKAKFLKEYKEIVKAKKKITKQLSKVSTPQGRHERAKRLGLIK